MGNLLTRRRELILADSGPTSDLLYSLSNQTWTEQIDTEVAPFISGRSTIIVFKCYIASNPTTSGAVGSVHRLFTVLTSDDSSRYCAVGKQSRGDNALGVCFVTTTYAALAQRSAAAGSKLFVITHEANSDLFDLYYRIGGSGNATHVQYTRTYTESTSTLKIGGTANGTQALPNNSTINKCEIYNRVLSAAEISALFA